MKNLTIFLVLIVSIMTLSAYIGEQEIFAENSVPTSGQFDAVVTIDVNQLSEIKVLFEQASGHLKNGEYKQAVIIYEEILEIKPNHITTSNMKGIAHSNMGDHTKSLTQFFKVLQKNPNDPIALAGMGIGFGNLGEYEESINYLNQAHVENPDNEIIKNYKKIIEKTIKKYPYESTEKPIDYKKQHGGTIPNWIKDTTDWWSMKKMNEQDFFKSIKYMIENDIIQIPEMELFEKEKNIAQIRVNLSKWSQNQSSNEEFFKNAQWLVENKFIDIKKSQADMEYEEYMFKKYLRNITKNISQEKRYIEYSNPSQDVIKKFLRDYVKWNFEQQVKMSSSNFPDPTYEIIDKTYIIKYKVYINQQPVGLPLDHVSTLQNSFKFWESQELKTNNQKAKIKFEITNYKGDANVWITWVVRNIGEGVLGHAHLGKGVVEVTLGDYRCDGSFQLYNIESVKKIMTHELGHSINLPHTNDKENIMYPAYTPSYAYCLLK